MLSGQRMAELKGIDIKYLMGLVKIYDKIKHLQEPNQEAFCIYTQSEAENIRLLNYKQFISSYFKFVESLPDPNSWHNKYDFRKAFNRTIDWRHDEPTPKNEYIKK